MLERISASGILLLAACWLPVLPAEGQQSGPGQPAEPLPADSSRSWAPVPTGRPPYPGAPLLITVPLSDLPYGLKGGLASPSMGESVAWNAGATQWADQSIAWLWEGMRPGAWGTLGTYLSLGLFDYFSVYLPLGQAWMHEEWHRAVLTHDGVPSYNGVYHWDIGAEAISVDHVSDRNLAEMKANHPADFTRLAEAGMEGEIEANRRMRLTDFFLGRPSDFDAIAWWASAVNGTAYIYICSIQDYDSDLAQANARETSESQRDFTGLDFRAWAYDMRHPGEAYADGPRGRTHPSGSGFDRYLRYSDLTRGERDYLRLQAGLSLLNLASPQMFGYDWMPGKLPDGSGMLWNFGLAHHLTPFGYAVGGDALVRRGTCSWVFSLQGLVNGEMALPGIGGELYRYPARLGRGRMFLTCGASAWLQPQDQLYRTRSISPGGSLSLGTAVPLLPYLELFAEADAKTAGWVAGNVYLEAAAQGRAGLQLRM